MENKLDSVNILLADIVENTGSNTEGLKLFFVLEKNINKKIIIKTNAEMGFSSSFLNSSIGMIIEKYGFDYFSNHVNFICSKSQTNILRDYIFKIKTIL